MQTTDQLGKPSNPNLVRCFQRGLHLMNVERSHDYAHTMFAECVSKQPDNLQFVEAMIKNLRAKHQTRSTSIGSLVFGGLNRKLHKALTDADWNKVLSIGIDLLQSDVWNCEILRAMATACAGLHFNEVELVYLKQALESQPKNIEVNRHCAHSLARMGQFDQSIACWHRVEAIKRGDSEASEMIARLCLEKLKYPGGKPPVTALPAKSIDSRQQSPENPMTRSGSIQALEQAISADATDLYAYIRLAELLLEKNQFADAVVILRRGVTICGKKSELIEKLQIAIQRRTDRELKLKEMVENSVVQEAYPFTIPWLELALAFAAIVLIIQFSPVGTTVVLDALDASAWTRGTWIMVNVYVLWFLLLIRMGPHLIAIWRKP
jgi:tetratricopeptide (TPR) repeat protein